MNADYILTRADRTKIPIQFTFIPFSHRIYVIKPRSLFVTL